MLCCLWIVSLLCALVGWKLGAVHGALKLVVSAASCILLLGSIAISRNLQLLPEWALVPLTAQVDRSWFVPAALLVFFIAARMNVVTAGHSNTQRLTRRAWLLMLLSGILVTGATMNTLQRVADGHSALPEFDLAVVDQNGVVRQTTRYTCGAAAAATLLRYSGVDEDATEAELAALCQTQPEHGATILDIAVGVATVARTNGYKARILQPSWAAFRELPMPVLCSVEFSPGARHALVVLAFDPKLGVRVADPDAGLYWCPPESFRKAFRNEVVTVRGATPQ